MVGCFSEPRVAAEGPLIALLWLFGGQLVFDLPVDLESNGDKSAGGMLAHRRR